MNSEWITMPLSEAISVNPKRSLRKGQISKFISMKDLIENKRKIEGYEYRNYSSGPKFCNGDTLMARITPCLENGKTAYVSILKDGETAFGSTEFIVLSGKNNVTDNKYVYYLTRSSRIRNEAIKSMTGTSGRQRVDNNVFSTIDIDVPPLFEQEHIATILSQLDEKIELNTQMNATLEAIGQALFNRWFVDFEFPDEDGNPYRSSGGEMVDSELGPIPKEWGVDKLAKIITITSGKRPNNKNDMPTEEHCYPIIGASKIMGFSNEYVYNEPILIIGRVGTHGVVQRFMNKVFPSDNTLVIKSKFYFYVYYILLNIDYASLNVGSTQPLITQTNVKNTIIKIPDTKILEKYELMVKSLFERIDINDNENVTLSNIRDTLLPKLMSGEIRVPVEEVAIP